MKGRDFVSDFGREIEVSEEELVRWYYQNVLSTAATNRRHNGDKGMLADKYIFLPRLHSMDKYLDRGLGAFFDNEAVRDAGLSRDGFVDYVEKLERETRSFVKEERILEL